jgi:hypothetical protein
MIRRSIHVSQVPFLRFSRSARRKPPAATSASISVLSYQTRRTQNAQSCRVPRPPSQQVNRLDKTDVSPHMLPTVITLCTRYSGSVLAECHLFLTLNKHSQTTWCTNDICLWLIKRHPHNGSFSVCTFKEAMLDLEAFYCSQAFELLKGSAWILAVWGLGNSLLALFSACVACSANRCNGHCRKGKWIQWTTGKSLSNVKNGIFLTNDNRPECKWTSIKISNLQNTSLHESTCTEHSDVNNDLQCEPDIYITYL